MSKKYKILKSGKNKGRVKALRSFSDIKAGDVGGFVESEDNLSHEGDCWVSDDARVSGNARVLGDAQVFSNALVYGNAQVYGEAQVYGRACVSDDNILTSKALFMIGPRDSITVTDKHIAIGCENHEFSYWLKHVKSIGKKHGYTKSEIKWYTDIIKLMIKTKIKEGK